MSGFRFIRKWQGEPVQGINGPVPIVEFEYEADFMENGRHVRKVCSDKLMKGRVLNTAQNVSYYPQLAKALGLKG